MTSYFSNQFVRELAVDGASGGIHGPGLDWGLKRSSGPSNIFPGNIEFHQGDDNNADNGVANSNFTFNWHYPLAVGPTFEEGRKDLGQDMLVFLRNDPKQQIKHGTGAPQLLARPARSVSRMNLHLRSRDCRIEYGSQHTPLKFLENWKLSGFQKHNIGDRAQEPAQGTQAAITQAGRVLVPNVFMTADPGMQLAYDQIYLIMHRLPVRGDTTDGYVAAEDLPTPIPPIRGSKRKVPPPQEDDRYYWTLDFYVSHDATRPHPALYSGVDEDGNPWVGHVWFLGTVFAQSGEYNNVANNGQLQAAKDALQPKDLEEGFRYSFQSLMKVELMFRQ